METLRLSVSCIPVKCICVPSQKEITNDVDSNKSYLMRTFILLLMNAIEIGSEHNTMPILLI